MKKIFTSVNKSLLGKDAEKFVILIIFLAMALIIHTYIVRLAVISGESMYPTFLDRDIIVINQINYTPSRGDVVLIDVSEKPIRGEYIVKRIIAVGGDTVTLDYENNSVFVNDAKIQEPYLNFNQEDPMIAFDATKPITYQVPVGTVFVMGDNRNNSLDSRNSMLGMVTTSDIIGNVCQSISIFRYFF